MVVIPTTLIAFLFPLYMNFFEFLWKALSPFVYSGVWRVCRLLFADTIEIAFDSAHYLILKHALLRVRIGQGCLGLDGMFLFTFAMLIAGCLWKGRYSKRQWGFFFVSGLIGMYFVALARIVLLFLIGISLRYFLGHSTGLILFKTIAHTHLGWVMYGAAIFGYLKLIPSVNTFYARLRVGFRKTKVA